MVVAGGGALGECVSDLRVKIATISSITPLWSCKKLGLWYHFDLSIQICVILLVQLDLKLPYRPVLHH